MIELCPGLFSPLLFATFSSTIHSLIYPEIWKTAFIKPLQKSDSKTDITNYRPILLLPRKLRFFLKKKVFKFSYNKLNNKSTPQHFGFQSRKSAFKHLINFQKTVRSQNSPVLYAVYLEYGPAFDSVQFKTLFVKLLLFGLDENFFQHFRSYFRGRHQIVLVQSHLSYSLSILSDVPHGLVSRPLLFVVFINDMPFMFLDAISRLFADNLNCVFNSIIFESDLVRLHFWNIANRVLANVLKTKYLSIRGDVSVFLGNDPFENIKHQKDHYEPRF